jgi:hypothetical protein
MCRYVQAKNKRIKAYIQMSTLWKKNTRKTEPCFKIYSNSYALLNLFYTTVIVKPKLLLPGATVSILNQKQRKEIGTAQWLLRILDVDKRVPEICEEHES